ncbi:MAG: outer membrane beta-barrel protein [Limisphaerales bacterium]
MKPAPKSLPAPAAGPLLAVLLCPSSALADAYDYLVYELGPVTLRPQVDILSTYNSNVFYQGEDETSDLITTFRPGFKVNYGYEDANFVSLEYNLSALVYLDNSELNDIGHLGRLRWKYKGARLGFDGNGIATQQDQLLGGFFGRIQAPVDTIQYTQDASVSYDFSPKTIVAVAGNVDFTDYTFDFSQPGAVRAQLYDGLTYSATLRAGYVLRDKITLYPLVTWGRAATSPNQDFNLQNPATYPRPDLEFYNFGFRADGEFTPRLTGSLQFAYELRDYLGPALAPLVLPPPLPPIIIGTREVEQEAPGGMVANASLKYQFSPKTAFNLSYRRQFSLSQELSTAAYTADVFGLGVQQQLGSRGKWVAGLSGNFTLNAYDENGSAFGERTDYLYFARADVAYRLQPWITLGLSQDFQTVESNFPGVVEYDVFRTNFRLFVGF